MTSRQHLARFFVWAAISAPPFIAATLLSDWAEVMAMCLAVLALFKANYHLARYGVSLGSLMRKRYVFIRTIVDGTACAVLVVGLILSKMSSEGKLTCALMAFCMGIGAITWFIEYRTLRGAPRVEGHTSN
jgi:hypothetical protein